VFVTGGCVNCHNKDGALERAPKKEKKTFELVEPMLK
jgi:hypothetical protein